MRYKVLLLLVIYLAFIALGLPDAILGSGWNLIREELVLPLGSLGMITFGVYIMSFIATYNAPRILRMFETKKITFISIAFTGVALILISQVNAFYQMVILSIPLGLGAGAIDVSLNHYLTKHYKAQHMNYLHSFYGVGVTVGPTIMAISLFNESWRVGYIIVGSILIIIALIVLGSFSIWHKEKDEERVIEHEAISLRVMFSNLKTVKSVTIFLLYVHIESLLGVWIASYFFIQKGVSYGMAALCTTAFYLSFTIGRFLSGVLSHKINPRYLVIFGEIVMVIGIIFLVLNRIDHIAVYFVLVVFIGLGCAPIYPNMMYLNKTYFKKEQLSKIMSLQMAIGYMGFGILTPLAGAFFGMYSIKWFPFILIIISAILLVLSYSYLYKDKLKEVEV